MNTLIARPEDRNSSAIASNAIRFEHLHSRCFLCKKKEKVFDTATRICSCVRGQGFPEFEAGCYISVLPELPSYSVLDLPSLWALKPADVFAVTADYLGGNLNAITRQAEAADGRSGVFPYSTDILESTHHLRCGNATLVRSSSLEDLTGSELVLVLDMGSYYWSGTLKDPRSWAIINTALASGITDVAVWTAGNAGVSLAKLAYFANRRLPPECRLQVHAIVDNDVAPEIRAQLRLWQCEVLDVFRQDKPVLNPEEIRSLVAARLRRSRRHLKEESYWHVTDGWDGVGLLMYRLIAAQTIRDISSMLLQPVSQPLDIVLPVGTGDLLLGFYLGLKDCEEAGLLAKGACRLVGALPAGANILANIRQRSIMIAPDWGKSDRKTTVPLMPKLTSLYTPLAPCLARIEKEGSVEFIVVTEADQLRAGRQVLSGGIDDGIVAEPSALVTLAALPHLGGHAGRERPENGQPYHWGRRILVINSGLGVLGHAEEMFLRSALGM